MSEKVNVEHEAKRRSLRVSHVEKAEREARLKMDAAEAKFRRQKELVLFIVVTVLASAIAAECLYIIVSEHSEAPTHRWQYATSILTAIVSALLGYLTGKTTSAPPPSAKAGS